MSQQWSYRAVNALAQRSHEEMRECLAKNLPFFGGHDNLNIRQVVFEQRRDHHSHFDSGTAGTIYVIKDPEAKAPDASAYRTHRLAGAKNPITPLFVLNLEAAAAPRLELRAVSIILDVLLSSPAFDLPSYIFRDDPLLQPPPRPGQLSVEKEGNTKQFMLGTQHQEEASYDGNMLVMQEWLSQLGVNDPRTRKRFALDVITVWVGDQLTASRLRGCRKMRCDDFNSYDRLDWMVETFGWFHLVFAVEHSLHKQYYGTRAGLGLVHAFEVMDRRYLESVSTKGTFHHTFEEAVDHTLEAHLRDIWCTASGAQNLEELREKSPLQLRTLASQIYHSYASTSALSAYDRYFGSAAFSHTVDGQNLNAAAEPDASRAQPANSKSNKSRSTLCRQQMQLIRDLLDYRILREAIHCGDVQTMEDMLPRLLLRFSGGRSPNYATEICELLQSLHREWPDDLRFAVVTLFRSFTVC